MDRSIFIGGLGPVQNLVGHNLFYDEKLIGPKLFSIPRFGFFFNGMKSEGRLKSPSGPRATPC